MNAFDMLAGAAMLYGKARAHEREKFRDQASMMSDEELLKKLRRSSLSSSEREIFTEEAESRGLM